MHVSVLKNSLRNVHQYYAQFDSKARI